MKLIPQSPKKALKAFLKQKPLRTEIDIFKTNLIALLDKISVIEKQPKDESEEHLKNNLRDFLRDTYYRDTNAINTKDKKDLVIHLGKETDSEVGVIIEAKRPSNKGEMLSAYSPNKKAIHELILYYMNERQSGNNELKQLVATSINEWFIFDANLFDKLIYRNNQIKKLYETKLNDRKDNPWFYEEIAKIISKTDIEIPCVCFDIRDYETVLRNNKKEDDRELIALFKILSPQHLLKIATPNDSNSLDERFYKELLHIIGLEEVREGTKNVIRQKKDNKNDASLIELTIEALKTEDTFHRIPNLKIYGENQEEYTFNIALELCITWINRILFLKLLEGQLITYHQGNKEYRFLNSETIHDFDELFKLFHKVLAVDILERSETIKTKYSRVPYLNSSLFEISELESQSIKINSLENDGQLEIINTTVLKDLKKNCVKLPTLNYLFNFLDAYDFASEGTEDVQEENKTIINASVLGKVFEKINGYKDGSIFTPAFITMYMCRQSIRLAVVEKFNKTLSTNSKKLFDTFEDLKNYLKRNFKTADIKQANEIINSLRICDPAVGSGHFLVSALNEIIAIKAELGVLADDKGGLISGYEIEIVNDELIITDQKGSIVEYKLEKGIPSNKEIQRLQKTLFHEKQTIIENCLFGVDINPKSVLICRLRLWIELLKNAYYTVQTHEHSSLPELQTLPNIDINIKCGNSLLSRFPLDADLSKALKSIKYDIKAYRGFVSDYKNEKRRDVKRGLQKIIDSIKSDFRTEIFNNDPKVVRLNKIGGELFNLLNQTKLFEEDDQQKKARKEKQQKLEDEISKLTKEIEDIKTNTLYKSAFEWRFEFPEVMNDNGDFEGFDLVIGNPPYIQLQSIKEISEQLKRFDYLTFEKTGDIYSLFYEKGNSILKNNGLLAYITSNKWMRAGYGKTTRNYFLSHTQPELLIDLGSGVFDEATVDSSILIFRKTAYQKPFFALDISKEKNVSNLYHFYNRVLHIKPEKDQNWTIASEVEQKIKAKIERIGKPLKDWDIKIYRGILTGYNEAFIIDGKKKDELIAADPRGAEIIKPILRGRDIKRYKAEFADLWLILIPKGFTIKRNLPKDSPYYVSEPSARYGNMPFDDAWSWFKENYPAIANHLLPFKSKAEARADKGDFWWELRACDYYQEFEKEKIVWNRIASVKNFSLVNKKILISDSMHFITGKNLNYLNAILNSNVIFWLLNLIIGISAGGNAGNADNIKNIPIPHLSASEQKPFVDLAEQILAKKEKGHDTTALENEIDRLVYRLYELTDEEINIIENIVK